MNEFINKLSGFCKTPEYKINFRNKRLDEEEPIDHYHDSCEIAFFINADIKVFLKDKQYEVSDGDILFLDEYEIHKIVYSVNSFYKRYVINFKKSYITDLLQELGISGILKQLGSRNSRKFKLNLKQMKDFEEIFCELLETDKKAIDRTEENVNFKEAEIKLKLAQLLIILSKAPDVLHTQNAFNKPESQVQKILAYIDMNYMNSITLDILEKEFFLSKYYILHTFKKITSLTVIEYLQLRRVIEAQDMLRNSSKSVTDICYASGFNSIQHFCRVFRTISNTTPAKYRSLYRQKGHDNHDN